MTGKVILLISPEPWGANFVSKHHYANYLSKTNRVYFLNPVERSIKNPLGNVNCQKEIVHRNLIILNYVNLLPRLNQFPERAQRRLYTKQARQILNAIGEKLDIVWSFDPFRFFDQKVWKAEKTIYHTVDFHPNAKFEKEIVLSSDHFFGVAQWILRDHENYRKGTLINHAADLDGFENLGTAIIPGKNKIRACYVGNLHKHIDYGVLENMVEQNNHVDFIIIGPIEDSNLSAGNKLDNETLIRLRAYSNIYFIGSVPPSQLMAYISACDINLVLFRKEHEKIHCSPHKLMGYFYSGNITLSNYIDAHTSTDPNIIKMIREQKEIPAAFHEIVSSIDRYNNQDMFELRRSFALANGYDSKIDEISRIVYAD